MTVLYEITMAIGGEVSVKPLLTKTLQQLLYHTSFPAGIVLQNLAAADQETVEARLEAVVGDYELGEQIGRTLRVPATLVRGGFELRSDPALLAAAPFADSGYTAYLRLPIDGNGVILLLAQNIPYTDLPITRIFQPVMANLAKAILLCRQHDAYNAGLITERDAAWERLRKVNRALKTLSAGNEVLVRASEELTLLQEMCHVVVSVGGYRLAWVGYAQQDEHKSVRPMAQHGIAQEMLASMRYSWAEDSYGLGPTGMAIRSREPQFIVDAYTDPRFAPWRTQAVAHQCASILALPLLDSDGHAFGVLTIDAAEKNAFDAEEIRLLGELANDLSYGIVSLRNRAERRRSSEQLSKALEDTVQVIASTVEMRDPYTSGHQKRVAQLAETIAARMGLPPEQVHGIRLACVVHDIGKIGTPAEILSKPSKLLELEYRIVKEHAAMGYNILKDVSFPWPIAEIAHQHHERMDGSGYPQGLRGDAILLEARIVAVADVVEAMASHRPYRPSLGIQAALDEIVGKRGVLYDEQVVDACRQVLSEGFSFA